MSEEKSTVQVSALIDRLLANPQLMESIAALLRDTGMSTADTKEEKEETEASPVIAEAVEDTPPPPPLEDEQKQEQAPSVPTSADAEHIGERRHRLLCAIKPYLSEPRAKALDSIEAIAELMNILKHA